MAVKSMFSDSLGNAVASRAKGSHTCKYHVISSPAGKWAVVLEGTMQPIRAFLTRKAAVSFARQYAIAQPATEVVVHGRDGSIASRIIL